MKQDHDALAAAVRARRDELGMTQEEASELSAKLDLEVLDGAERARPGIALSTWREIERAVPKKRRPHTQAVLDWTLDWPLGTTNALLYGRPAPEGPPASKTRGQDESGLRAQALRERAEVDGLWRTVGDLTARLESVEEALQKILDAVEGV